MNLFIYDDQSVALWNAESVEEANAIEEQEEDGNPSVVKMIPLDELPKQFAWLCAHFDSCAEFEEFIEQVYKSGYDDGKNSV